MKPGCKLLKFKNLCPMQKLILATRSSPLALWQANEVAAKLNQAGVETELKAMETLGDKKLDVTLSKIGDKGVFTQELEQMLLDGEAHLAVHSAKDMPSRLPDGLEIIAFTARENPCDVLVSHRESPNLENLSLKVGTSSTRRVALLKRYYPHIQTVSIRGNLQTRIHKMEEGQCDALLLAYAGVFRMGYSDLIREQLSLSIFTPPVGQGALAIEICSTLSPDIQALLKQTLHDPTTGLALAAERSFLRTMDGGCSVPVFGYASFKEGTLEMQGGIVSLDGSEEIRQSRSIQISAEDVENARLFGKELAEHILNSGGDSVLSKIKQNLRP